MRIVALRWLSCASFPPTLFATQSLSSASPDPCHGGNRTILAICLLTWLKVLYFVYLSDGWKMVLLLNFAVDNFFEGRDSVERRENIVVEAGARVRAKPSAL